MPIVDKINALTGKSAETIEDAIANMSGGGNGNVVAMTINASATPNNSEADFEVQDCSMSFDEAFSVIEDGKCLVAAISFTTDPFPITMYGFAILSGVSAAVAPSAPLFRIMKGCGYVADIAEGSELIAIDVLWQQPSEFPSISRDNSYNVFPVVTFFSDDGEHFVCNDTYSEVKSMLGPNLNAIVKLRTSEGEEIESMLCDVTPSHGTSGEYLIFSFRGMEFNGSQSVTITQPEISFSSDESIEFETKTITLNAGS